MAYLLALVAGYLGLLAGLSMLAHRDRQDLAVLLAELRADYPADHVIHRWCDEWATTAYSMRAAPITFLRLVALLITPSEVIEERCQQLRAEHPDVVRDRRVFEASDCYYASIIAVNPIAGLLMWLARYAFRLKGRLYRHGAKARELECAALALPT